MYQLTQVLPHRAPMVLIDSLKCYSSEHAECEVTIAPSSMFFDCETDSVPAYVGIEYMAQSIAAFAGANDIDNGHEVGVGFLLGSRRYNAFTNGFRIGAKLTINVKRLYQEDSGLSVFDCNIVEQEEILAEAKVNVFQPDDAKQYIAAQQQALKENSDG